MKQWTRQLARVLAMTLLAGAALAVEIAPTLALAAPNACAPFAALVAHSSCIATAYGEAQRIAGGAGARMPSRDASCASVGIL